MLITATFNEQDIGSIDKTYNEIINAINNGVMPVLTVASVERVGFNEIDYPRTYGQGTCNGINVYYVEFSIGGFYSTDPNTNMTTVNPCSGNQGE